MKKFVEVRVLVSLFIEAFLFVVALQTIRSILSPEPPKPDLTDEQRFAIMAKYQAIIDSAARSKEQ